MATNLVFFHGWGFDCSFWHPIIKLIKQDNVFFNIFLNDYGYFGPAATPTTPYVCPWVAITHSLGLIKMINLTQLQGCVAIINYAGFLHFAGYEAVLNTMIAKLLRNAPMLLTDFYKNCNLPKELQPVHNTMHINKLAEDLRYLRIVNLEHTNFYLPMLNLYTADDAIVKPKHRIFANKPNYHNVMLKTGGHAALYNNPSQFYPWIRHFLLMSSKAKKSKICS